MKLKIPEQLTESAAANAFIGFFIILWINLIISFTPWDIFPQVKMIKNPTYDPSLGEVWIESCGSNGVPYGDMECSYYDANSQYINDPHSQRAVVYFWIASVVIIYVISKIAIQRKEIKTLKQMSK
jgi:hypothetical protein